MRITCLGTGDAFGSGGRLHACFLLDFDGGRLMVDCGASSLSALRRAGIAPNDVDAIALSHLHGDHFAGAAFLLVDAQVASRRSRPLVIAGPTGTGDRVAQAMEVMFPGSTSVDRRFELEFAELEPGREVEVGRSSVTAYPVVHPSGAAAYALRLRCGSRVVAYSGDTEWTSTLIDVARGADLFICEAYFYEKRIPYHLDYRTLMEHRSELECDRIVLTHMSEDMLGRLELLDCEAAEDGGTIEL
jgi:ribonuclease BN (tRNA processing enzyme)